MFGSIVLGPTGLPLSELAEALATSARLRAATLLVFAAVFATASNRALFPTGAWLLRSSLTWPWLTLPGAMLVLVPALPVFLLALCGRAPGDMVLLGLSRGHASLLGTRLRWPAKLCALLSVSLAWIPLQPWLLAGVSLILLARNAYAANQGKGLPFALEWSRVIRAVPSYVGLPITLALGLWRTKILRITLAWGIAALTALLIFSWNNEYEAARIRILCLLVFGVCAGLLAKATWDVARSLMSMAVSTGRSRLSVVLMALLSVTLPGEALASITMLHPSAPPQADWAALSALGLTISACGLILARSWSPAQGAFALSAVTVMSAFCANLTSNAVALAATFSVGIALFARAAQRLQAQGLRSL
jgi:hypothetical protein